MSNLIQNPSFEEGLNFWSAHNVTISDNNPFEGTATARLGPGIASITQDILLGIPRSSLLLSFAVEAPAATDPGNLTVVVKWLDKYHREIGNGLSILVSSAAIGRQVLWLTEVNVTDLAPENVFKARIIFSKSEGTAPNNFIDLDLVVLTKVATLVLGVN
ncbi:MAG: hypothetical protein ABSC17_01045 [Thermacetogeniaceae bacterium]